MNALRNTALAILDKIRALLMSEPARLIGYGAAAMLVGVVYVLNAMGITRFGEGLSFDAALALSTMALTFLGIVVEGIRKFVYSPQTYIEDLADEARQAHAEAHAEEEVKQFLTTIAAEAKAAAEAEPTVIPVAPAPKVDPSKQN